MKKYIFSQNIKKFFRKQILLTMGEVITVSWIEDSDLHSQCVVKKRSKFIFERFFHKTIKKPPEFDVTEGPVNKQEYLLRKKRVLLEITYKRYIFSVKKAGYEYLVTIDYYKKYNTSVLSVENTVDHTMKFFDIKKWIKDIVGEETTFAEYELHELISRKS